MEGSLKELIERRRLIQVLTDLVSNIPGIFSLLPKP